MPDWSPLRAAILHDDPNARRLDMLRQIESWLDLPWEQALAACTLAAPTLERAREVNGLLNLTTLALRNELGIADGPAGTARFQALAAGFQAGSLAPSERRLWERTSTAFGLWFTQRQQDPAVAEAAPKSAQETQLRAALDALIARQNEAQKYAVPGAATVERMDTLEGVVADYRRLVAMAPMATPVHEDICFFAAHAAYALARGWWILGRVDRAAQLYAEAALLYDQGGRPIDARQSADKARELGHVVTGDLGNASRQDLRDLIERDTDPLTRARAQARLSTLASAANDLFDALEWAEKSVASLVAAGFADPQASEDCEPVWDAWIANACGARSSLTAPAPPAPPALPALPALPAPTAPLKCLLEVGALYQSLLAARHARWAATDPARAARSEVAVAALNRFLLEVAEQPAAAHLAVTEGLRRYAPALAPAAAAPVDDGLARRLQALSDRLTAIKLEANAADAANAAAGAAADARPDASVLQALTARAADCVEEARAMALGPTIGLACQTEAYVRLRAADSAGAERSAAEGEVLVLGGLAATPQTLAGHPQFDLLLELRKVRLQALAAQADSAGLLALAQETVQLIEARRYQFSDPYQQGAFLADRTFFYEMAVLASFHLKDWDSLLCAMELIKARAALLNRLSPRPAVANADLNARLEAARAALAIAPEGSEARLAATEQRRLLMSLLAIERREAGPAAPVPTLSIAALQGVLAADEAAVAWVWVAAGVLIVVALDAGRVHVERVVMSADDCELLAEHVDMVRTSEVTLSGFDAMVNRLAAVVLPADTRRFVAGAKRLILSPHRALHLLPLHAALFDGRFLVEQAAVRYVPNLGSLLLPWGAEPAAPAETGNKANADRHVLALGANTFTIPGETWKALKTAESEARAVAEVWAGHGVPATLLLGEGATLAAFHALAPSLGTCRCLHLATHGASVFAPEAANDPLASRIMLHDGALDALAIGQLSIGAEVVVLSACDSGQRALGGRGLAELPGDDIFGLQAALFDAGAHSVVGALWPVDDRVAPLIVSVLHTGLARGLAPEVALRDAFLDYLKRPDARRRIYFWAPLFVSSMGRRSDVSAYPPQQEIHHA